MNSTPRRSDSRSWFLLKTWVLVCAGLSAAGWLLAFTGYLNRTGYAVVLMIGLVGLVGRFRSRPAWAKWRSLRRRWRRPLPAIFGLVFACAALGGALHPPNNYDALTYRLPQILHWLDLGRWHWIPASDRLMNITGPGHGWLMAPLLALTHSDRALFLPNLAALAILPGAFFSIVRACGASGRVAWSWMWLLPTGGCYAMQAGGIGNDLLATAYALAALALALRARHTGALTNFWVSGLAFALATGVKVMVLPLALPWLYVTLPCWCCAVKKLAATGALLLVALLVSFVPTAVLNTLNTGAWSGDPEDQLKLQITNPARGLIGNSIQLVVGSAAPPLFPFSGAANRVFKRFETGSVGVWIKQAYPRFDLSWGELAMEESSGLGLGLLTLAVVSWVGGLFRRKTLPGRWSDPGFLVAITGGVAVLVFLARVGSEAAPRLAAPYYPFLLIPIFRLPGNTSLCRCRWWRVLAILAAGSTLPALILTPSRPLWPARMVMNRLAEKFPRSPAIQRATLVYATYAQRHDHIAPLRPFIPAGARAIGFVPALNDAEAPLWKPYGRWRVIEVHATRRTDSSIKQLRGSVVIASERGLGEHFGQTAAEFAAAIGGRIVGSAQIIRKVQLGPEEWFVVAVD